MKRFLGWALLASLLFGCGGSGNQRATGPQAAPTKIEIKGSHGPMTIPPPPR